jgi:Protein of unknown function (DUF3828)
MFGRGFMGRCGIAISPRPARHDGEARFGFLDALLRGLDSLVGLFGLSACRVTPHAGNTRLMNSASLCMMALLVCAAPAFAEPPATDLSKPAAPAAESAEAVVKKIYDLAKNNQGPFFQTRDRAAMEKWLAKDLAALVAKDAANSPEEVGVLDFDPLYYAQDTEIADFKLKSEKEGGGVHVIATFKNFGQADTIRFVMAQAAGKSWKIADIRYKDNTSLKKMLEEGLQRE